MNRNIRCHCLISILLPLSDPTLQVPPCPSELLDVVEEGDDEDRPNIKRSHSERLLTACREFANNYREIQEKYHESIYNAAEKQLRNSQAVQMKRLKVGILIASRPFGISNNSHLVSVGFAGTAREGDQRRDAKVASGPQERGEGAHAEAPGSR